MPIKPFHKDKFPVYYTSIERLIIRRAAHKHQLSISEWIRRTTLQHPEFIQEQQVVNSLPPDTLFTKSPKEITDGFFGGSGRPKGPLFGDGSEGDD